MAAPGDKRIRISKLCSNLGSWTPILQGFPALSPITGEALCPGEVPWGSRGLASGPSCAIDVE